MLKIIESFNKLALIIIEVNINKIVDIKRSLELILLQFKKTKMVKYKNIINSSNFKNIDMTNMKTTMFLISAAGIIFIQLRAAFIIALIFLYFDPKYYILIKIDIFDNIIDEISNQPTFNHMILELN